VKNESNPNHTFRRIRRLAFTSGPNALKRTSVQRCDGRETSLPPAALDSNSGCPHVKTTTYCRQVAVLEWFPDHASRWTEGLKPPHCPRRLTASNSITNSCRFLLSSCLPDQIPAPSARPGPEPPAWYNYPARLTTPFGGELDSTGWVEGQVACRGWSAGHVKSRPKCYLPRVISHWLPNNRRLGLRALAG